MGTLAWVWRYGVLHSHHHRHLRDCCDYLCCSYCHPGTASVVSKTLFLAPALMVRVDTRIFDLSARIRSSEEIFDH